MKKFKSMLCLVLVLFFSSTMLVGCKKATTLSADMITLSQTAYVYDGTAKCPEVTVTRNGETVDSSLYEYSYSNNTNAGTATVTVTAVGEKNKVITGSVNVEFTIAGASLGEISAIASKTYNGENQVPTVEVGDNRLTDDYTLSWKYKELGADDSTYVSISGTEFVDAGVYQVTATGCGNYAGTKTATYQINKAEYTDLSVARADYTYSMDKSSFVFSKTMVADAKYYYSTSDNFTDGELLTKDTELNVGKYYFYAEVDSSKNYTGFTTAISSFNVLPYDISNVEISLDKESYDYTGNEVTPKPTLVNSSLTLVESTDYTLAYKNNIYAGTATITATGKGNYTGTKTINFEIEIGTNPCDKHTPLDPVIENIVKATLDSDGSYDSVVRCEICLREVSREVMPITKVSRESIVISVGDYVYSGEAFEPSVSVAGFTFGEDYTVTYNNNVNAGTAEVVVEFINEYYDILVTEEFEIAKAEVTKPAIVGTFTYNGEAQTALEVTADDLFTVSASNVQTNAGEYEVVVSLKDKDNYKWANGTSEDLTLEFVINKAEVVEPTINGTFTYNGEAQTALEVTADDLFTVSASNVQTNAGEYEVVVSLKDKDNYKWANGTSEDLTLEFVINKAEVVEPTINGTFTYNGEAQTAIEVTSDDLFTVSASNVQTNAGEYDVVVSLKDKDNYKWANGTSEDLTLEFVINKLKVVEPTINGTFTYNGEAQTALEVTADDLFTVSASNVQTNAGEYEVVVSLKDKDNYKWANGTSEDLTLEFVINKAEVVEPTINGAFTYNGEPQTALEVTADDLFTVSASNVQTNAGEYDVVVSLKDKDNYMWKANGTSEDLTLEFVINKLSIETGALTLSSYEYTFDGSNFEPVVTVTLNGSELVINENYLVEYKNNKNAGTAEVVVTGVTNYEGELSDNFAILKKRIVEPTVEGEYTFNYEVQTVELSYVSDDFIVSNNTATNAGDYYVKVALADKTNFIWDTNDNAEDLELLFVINPMDLSSAELTLSQTEYVYTGEEFTPDVDVVLDGVTLEKDVDFEVSYLDNKRKGTAWVVVTGSGNYIGEARAMFSIGLKNIVVPTIVGDYTYTGEDITAELVNSCDDIIVTGLTQRNAGYYDVKLTLADKYNCVWYPSGSTDDIILHFEIEKASIVAPEITGTYTYNKEVQTPEIINTEDLDKYMLTSVSGKDAGTYYVNVTLKDTQNYEWAGLNTSEALKLSFVIKKVEVTKPEIVGTYVFDGSAHTAKLSVEELEYYEVLNRTQTSIGKHNVIVRMLDKVNYVWEGTDNADDLTLVFEIVGSSIENAELSLSNNTFVYTGSAITPQVTLVIGGKTLAKDIDYTVVYENNTNVGTATVTVTGINNYYGELTAEFTITPEEVEAPTMLDRTYIYNGLEQTIAFSENTSGHYTITGNVQTNAGKYKAYAVLNDKTNYVWKNTQNSDDLSFDYEIKRSLVEMPTIADINAVYTYNGKEQEMKFNNVSDFVTVENNKQTEAGKYEVVISLNDKDNYYWNDVQNEANVENLRFDFVIAKLVVSVPKAPAELYYTGGEIIAVAGNDYYTVTNGTKIDAGRYRAVAVLVNKNSMVWSDNNTSDDLGIIYEIKPIEILKASYNYSLSESNFTYTGEEIKPTLKEFIVNGLNLVLNKDYTLSYENNIEVGSATLIITAKGNYEGTLTVSFAINRIVINDADVTLSITEKVYNGVNEAPVVTIVTNGKTLTETTDYNLVWRKGDEVVTDLTNAGTYTLAVVGAGNYSANITRTFVVNKADYENVTVVKNSYDYDAPTTASLSSDVYGDVTYYYANVASEDVWNEYSDALVLEVGSYKIYAVIAESENYNKYTTNVVEFVVNKSTRKDITISRENFDYGSQVDFVISGYEGDDYITYYYGENETKADAKVFDNTTVFNAGTYNIFLVIPESEGYQEYTSEVSTFTVYRIEYSETITAQRESYRYGETKTPTTIIGFDVDMNFVELYYNLTNSNENGTAYTDDDTFNAGTYYIYAVILEHGNYKEYKTEASMFVVEKGTYKNITVVIDNFNYGLSVTPSLSTSDIEGEVSYFYGVENLNHSGSTFTDSSIINAGTYYIYAIISETANYNSYATETATKFVISKLTVGKPSISGTTYNGYVQNPVSNTDYYTVNNGSYINAGSYEIVVSLKDKDNYIWAGEVSSDDLTFDYTISPASISLVQIELSQTNFDFDGTAKTPTVSVYFNNTIVPASEYEVSYENNITSGTAYAVVTAKVNTNFVGEVRKEFSIGKSSYTDIIVSRDSYSYLQNTQISLSSEVEGTVRYYYNLVNSDEGGIEFTAEDILNVGTYYFYAVIEASDNYAEYKTKTSVFMVFALNLSTAVVELNSESFSHTGLEIEPTVVSVKVNGVLVSSDNYDVSYENNIEVGNGIVKITAKENSNCTGTATKEFAIKKLDFTEAVVEFVGDSVFEYTGNSILGNISLSVSLGGTTLVEGTDYTWNIASGYSDIAVGTTTIEVHGMGGYSGTIYVSCEIVPASIENAVPTFATATTYKYTGSDLRVGIDSNIDVTVDGLYISASDYLITWTKDGAPVDFIINAGTYIATITGKGNYTGTAIATLSVNIGRQTVNKAKLLLYPEELSYTGEDFISLIDVEYDDETLVLGQDYTIVWKNEDGVVVTEIIDAGTYTAEITILTTGNYSYSRGVITKTLNVS